MEKVHKKHRITTRLRMQEEGLRIVALEFLELMINRSNQGKLLNQRRSLEINMTFNVFKCNNSISKYKTKKYS